MTHDENDVDRAIIGRTLTHAMIEHDRDAMQAALEHLGTRREAQFSEALALVWAEMLPAYLAATPDAQLLADGRQLVDEIGEWLARE